MCATSAGSSVRRRCSRCSRLSPSSSSIAMNAMVPSTPWSDLHHVRALQLRRGPRLLVKARQQLRRVVPPCHVDQLDRDHAPQRHVLPRATPPPSPRRRASRRAGSAHRGAPRSPAPAARRQPLAMAGKSDAHHRLRYGPRARREQRFQRPTPTPPPSRRPPRATQLSSSWISSGASNRCPRQSREDPPWAAPPLPVASRAAPPRAGASSPPSLNRLCRLPDHRQSRTQHSRNRRSSARAA